MKALFGLMIALGLIILLMTSWQAYLLGGVIGGMVLGIGGRKLISGGRYTVYVKTEDKGAVIYLESPFGWKQTRFAQIAFDRRPEHCTHPEEGFDERLAIRLADARTACSNLNAARRK